MKEILLAIVALLPCAGYARSLCIAGEQVVFSCVTVNKRLASVCVGSSGLKYRFGRASAPDITISDPGPDKQSPFLYFHYFRSGVDRTSLDFETADAEYSVFTNVEEPDIHEAGVIVRVKRTSRTVELSCSTKPEVSWFQIEGKVACSEDDYNSCTPP